MFEVNQIFFLESWETGLLPLFFHNFGLFGNKRKNRNKFMKIDQTQDQYHPSHLEISLGIFLLDFSTPNLPHMNMKVQFKVKCHGVQVGD